MTETVVAFQSQLSGVMEAVFKAAMFEITRLVEDSFLEEIALCREQVESLKRKLKASESHKKQSEGEACNAETQTETEVKLENNSSNEVIRTQTSEDVTYEVKQSPKARPPCAQSKTPNRGRTQSDVPVLPDLPDVKRDSSDDDFEVPGSNNQFSSPKYQLHWEEHFDTKPDFEQNDVTDISSKSLFENTYHTENLEELNSNFKKKRLTENTDDDLIYMGQYEDDIKPSTSGEQQQCQIGESSGNVVAWSSSKTSTEFNGLLINEKGHFHDPNNLYSDHSEFHPDISEEHNQTRAVPLNNSSDMLRESNTNSDISHIFELLQHQSLEIGLHTCDFCTATFPDPSTLKAHKQMHKEQKRGLPSMYKQRQKSASRSSSSFKSQGPHLCGHCGKAFPSLFKLQKHKCDQTGVKPYSCAVCGNRFSRLWNLKLHQRIHTQEKPHHCTVCDKSFTRADILKVHQRTHTGERPYCCLVCGLSFKRLDHLKSHQRKHMTDQ